MFEFNGVQYKDYADFMDAMNPARAKEPLMADGWTFDPSATQEEIEQALIEMNYTPEQAAKTSREAIESQLCPQCKENYSWNMAGGYKQSAEECHKYCVNEHK